MLKPETNFTFLETYFTFLYAIYKAASPLGGTLPQNSYKPSHDLCKKLPSKGEPYWSAVNLIHRYKHTH